MNRAFRVLSVSIMVAFMATTLVACGGGGDGEPDVIYDVTLPDSQMDSMQDVPPDTTPPDVRPDEGTDVVCTCTVADDCCDGCNVINEGGACAMEGAGNCKTPVCQSGACVAVDVVCAPDGKCLFDNGTCNLETGACEFDLSGALPNGTSCEAQPGIDGSGACILGVCQPFGECDFRAYDQAAGMPCNFDSECASGLCMADGWGWDHFCTQRCETAACPDGLRCTKNADNEYFCMRIGTDNYPGDGTIELFKPCNRDEDCAGGLCLGFDTTRFCTMNCESEAGGTKDSAKCGECGACEDGGTDNGFQFEFYCVPEAEGREGAPCQSPLDCNNHFCYEGYCSNQCFIFGEDLDSCPDGFECVLNAYNGDVAICVADTSLNKPFGAECMHDYECSVGTCRDVAGTTRCITGCDDCTDGECRQVGWIRIDTMMELWKDGAEAAVATDDNAGEGNLSRISYYVQEAGTYFIGVKGVNDVITGPYYLDVRLGEQAMAETTVDEVEANDDKAGAEAKTAPFRVKATMEAAGQDWFKFEVAFPEAATSVRVLAEAVQFEDLACVPKTVDGGAGYGEACVWEWQCADGFDCLNGVCNKVCEIDSDCPNGICFAYSDTDKRCVPAELVGGKDIQDTCEYAWECDEMCLADGYLGEYYCSKACTTELDCPHGMGCVDKVCNKGFPTPNFPYGYCRMNADCESYVCTDGMCTETCAADEDCEGAEAIVPEGPMDLCASCATNADCNDGTEDFFNEAYCVQVSETEMFCTPQCTFDEGSCPVGTRCYSLDGFTKVCAPVSFTCQAGGVGCQETAGLCVRPYINDGDACRFDEECIGGKCANGICRSETCDGDLECDCELLACNGGYCEYYAAEGRVMEVEPNNDVDTAQVIQSIPMLVMAAFNPVGMTQYDNDIFKFAVTGGMAYSFITGPSCGVETDPAMLLRDGDGEYIDGYAIADSATSYFPAIFGYVPAENGFVYVEIVQDPWVDGFLRQPYVLEVSSFLPVTGDNCSDDVAMPIALSALAMNNVTDSTASPTVVGDTAGPDLVRWVDVPGVTDPGNFSVYLVQAEPNEPADNLSMWAFTDCDDPAGTAVTWSNFNVGKEGTEGLTLVNTTADPVRYFIAMNVSRFGAGPVNLTTLMTMGDTPFNYQGESLDSTLFVEIEDTPVMQFMNLAYPWTNDVAPTGGLCADKDMSGKDIVYSVKVPDGKFLKVEMKERFTAANMYILDAQDTNNCVAFGPGPLYYMPEWITMPPVAVDHDVYIVVEPNGHPGGAFSMELSIMDVGECAGPCDPATAAVECADTDNICYCDQNTKFWNKFDCKADCLAQDYTIGGECHLYSTGDSDGQSGCMCHYDCSIDWLPGAMCDNMSYTNCTCSSENPCGWANDAYCDDFCMNEYEDHFDDTGDCTPAP